MCEERAIYPPVLSCILTTFPVQISPYHGHQFTESHHRNNGSQEKGKPRSRYVVKKYPDLFRGQEVHFFSWYSGIANLIRRVLPKITPVDGMIKHLAQ